MRTIKQPLIAVCVALTCVWGAQASAMTRAEYKAAEDRIGADYKAAKQRCDGLSGNTKDVGEKEAKGNEKIAKPELEAQYKPSDKNRAKIAEAKADAAYDVAREKCDELAGNAKDVCQKDAKAAHSAAKTS